MTDMVADGAGKVLLDATQEAVIDAVSDVESIIQSTTGEIVGNHHELFYQSPEFWVGMAFVLVVIGLFLPIRKALSQMLQKGIDDVVRKIDEAAGLRDEAQKLLADYEQRMESVKEQSESIVRKAHKDAAAFRGRELNKLGKELTAQEKSTSAVIEALQEKVSAEAAELITARTLQILRSSLAQGLSDEDKADLIDKSIQNIADLRPFESVK